MAVLDGNNELLFVGFNQDYGCFACGTTTGFRIYNCDPFKETFKRGFNKGGIGWVEMLFRCNILALVGGGKNPRYPPHKVMIWDDHQNRCIGELSFRSKVRAVKLRRDRVVVVLEYKIYVYNFADLKLLDHIETYQNTKGLCAICPYTPSTVLVCPGLQKGHVRCELYDTGKTQLIPAHEGALSCLALNSDGTRLATASEKGTLIRVFNTHTGQALQELRRGSDRAEIYSLAFNPTTEWLACSSDKGTVHIFSLSGSKTTNPRPKPRPRGKTEGSSSSSSSSSTDIVDPTIKAPETTMGKGTDPQTVEQEDVESKTESKDAKKNPTSSLSFLSNLLPKWVSSEWSFAQYRVPDASQTIVAFGEEKNSIIIVSGDGVFYKATFDPDKPGSQCQLQFHQKFVKDPSEEETSSSTSSSATPSS